VSHTVGTRADALGRCDSDDSCINVKANFNQNAGNYELLSVSFALPGESEVTGAGELGELIWTMSIPASTSTDQYYAEFSCNGDYFGSLDDDFGLGTYVQSAYPVSTKKSASDTDQMFVGDDPVTLKVNPTVGDAKTVRIIYESEFTTTMTNENMRYWFVMPIKSGVPGASSYSTDWCYIRFKQLT
jgi:hypothetical protein